jgi:hypothetical protein
VVRPAHAVGIGGRAGGEVVGEHAGEAEVFPLLHVPVARQGQDSRRPAAAAAPPLAALGGPSAFTPDIWNAFSHPGAEQRIQRLLAIPGQPSFQHAARQLGIRHALLAGQVRQLEAVVGTELLRTGPDERLTLTAYGRLFARDVAPALESLAQSRSQATSHTP